MNANRRRRLLATILMLVSATLAACDRSKNMTIFPNPATALEPAIQADDPTAIARVLASGVDVNVRGQHNITPLMLAVDRLKPKAVAELLARGANPNHKADDGAGPVSLAVENYRDAPDIMLMIFRAGGDANTRGPDDDPVIMQFMVDHNCEYMRLLKSFGANLDITTRAGDPIVTTAALRQNWDDAWCLIELGAKFDYEQTSRRPISRSLRGTFPAPDSPIYPYKVKVWKHLKAHGIAVPPLNGSEPGE